VSEELATSYQPAELVTAQARYVVDAAALRLGETVPTADGRTCGAYREPVFLLEVDRQRLNASAVDRHLLKAAAELRRCGNLPDLAMALASIGGVELQKGNIDAARPWVQQALDVAVEAADDYRAVGAHYTFGWLEFLAGDSEAARRRALFRCCGR